MKGKEKEVCVPGSVGEKLVASKLCFTDTSKHTVCRIKVNA